MRLKQILLGFLGLGLFAACSQEDAPNMGGNESIKFQGDGYLAVNIKLPTRSGTRALNDQFDDGLADEYKVNDAAILLFKGESEADATFIGAYEIDGMDEVSDVDNDNITSSYLKAVKVNNMTLFNNENLYGLVMLNYKHVGEVTGSEQKDENGNVTSVPGFTLSDGTRLDDSSDLSSLTTIETSKFTTVTKSINGKNEPYFFMVNSPVVSGEHGGGYDVPSINTTVSTLVKMSHDLKDTEAEAKLAPAGSFFVERAVAKATLGTIDNLTVQIGLDENGNETTTSKNLKIENIGWVIENVEPTSYIVRNLGDYTSYVDYFSNSPKVNPKKYRFVGDNPIGTTSIQPVTKLYRPYWCKDPHYSAALNSAEKLTAWSEIVKNLDFGRTGPANPQYCNENTFNVEHQSYGNTTRAIIKGTVTVGDGGTFYTINDDETTLYTDSKNAESKSRTYILESQAIYDAFNRAFKLKGTTETVVLDATDFEKLIAQSGSEEKGTGIVFKRGNDGYRTVTAINLPTGADLRKYIKDKYPSTISDDNFDYCNDVKFLTVENQNQGTQLMKSVNNLYRIAEYAGGVNYWDVRFKHFGNDLTPWEGKGLQESTSESYGTGDSSEQDYLGRYGMVRNNWYDINITSIKKLGKPEIPDVRLSTTADDNHNEDKWISFTINVLSWAKRTQDVDL